MNKPLTPVSRTLKAADRVAMQLVQHIVENDLRAGDLLPNERDMLDLLRVSRGTLREGLRLLETQGAITMRSGPGGGPVVREPRAEDLLNSATLILQLMRVSFETIVDARQRLEPVVAAAAAEACGPEDIEALQRGVEDLADVLDRGAAVDQHQLVQQRDSAYCRSLGAATHSDVWQIAMVTMRSISELIELQMPQAFTPEILATIVRNRRRTVEAISDGDGVAAAAYVRRYWDGYRTYFAEHYPTLLRQPISWRPTIEP